MGKGRLEAFSDGVVAIIITIMVLELKVPADGQLAALRPLIPAFSCYVFSFVIVGIYWNNHHHLLHTVQHIAGTVLWANLHLLFWLSLLPFATAWMGENQFSPASVASYGVVLLMAAVAYTILTQSLIRRNATLATAVGSDVKGWFSLACYVAGVGLSFANRWVALGCYALVAIIWLIPDRRIERVIDARERT